MDCSLYHEGLFIPRLSRTRVIKFEEKGRDIPTVCFRCRKPQCMAACLQRAISASQETGSVVVNDDLRLE